MKHSWTVKSLAFSMPALAIAAAVCVSAAVVCASVAVVCPSAAAQSGGDEDSAGDVPFVVSLSPATGRPGVEDRTRAVELEAYLGKRLGSLLNEAGYSSIRVEILADWDGAATRLRESRSNLVECDPVLYFLTVATRDRLQSRYRVLLQAVEDPMPRGVVLAPRSLGLTRPEDLQNRSVAFLHRIAGGAAQVQRALNERGLSPNNDYSFWDAGYLENALRCLELGLVDAVAVPSDMAESGLQPKDLEGLATVLETGELLPPLFAVRRADIERFPAFGEGLTEALRSHFGPDHLVHADDDLYERTKQEGLPWE